MHISTRQAVVSAWTQYVAARESVDANRQVIDAAQLALNGVIEERNVGQRTTLDVLNAQNAVITAKINQASSERDVVVASYAILSAMGRLSVDRLGLAVTKYRPEEHYNAVKDKWFGLRTPDGRLLPTHASTNAAHPLDARRLSFRMADRVAVRLIC